MVALAALAFVAIFFLGVPFPLIVLGAAIIGLVGGRLWPELFSASASRAGAVVPPTPCWTSRSSTPGRR